MGSRGSVIPYFLRTAKQGTISITDPEMTRFNISLKEGVNMVSWAAINSIGGEIFVPKIPSYRIMDLAEAIGPNCEKEIIGIRPGEKIHEEMITSTDSFNTIDLGNYYAILPSDVKFRQKYENMGISFSSVPDGFSYNSGKNTKFLNINEIRYLIIENLDKNFIPS